MELTNLKHVTKLLLAGSLDDEFAADPVKTTALLMKAIGEGGEMLHPTHGPVILSQDEANDFRSTCDQLAQSLGVELPSAGTDEVGVPPVWITLLMPLLIRILERWAER